MDQDSRYLFALTCFIFGCEILKHRYEVARQPHLAKMVGDLLMDADDLVAKMMGDMEDMSRGRCVDCGTVLDEHGYRTDRGCSRCGKEGTDA